MARYTDQVFDEYHRPVEGAEIHVFTPEGAIVALTDDGGFPMSNPMLTDTDGIFYFNAPDAQYELEVRFSGQLEYREIIWLGTGGGGVAVSDEPYGPLWDGDIITAASKNALYDKIETLSGSFAGDSELSQIITGLQVIWLGGLNFSMSAGTYYIDGVSYTAVEQTITLDAADPSNARIDVLAVDITGTLVKVKGQPAANPSEPDVDPVTQLKLIFVTIAAGATAPAIPADEIIYAEGAEWTPGGQGGFVVNSTSEPDTGSVCIAGTNVAGNNESGFGLDRGTPILRSDYRQLILRIKSKTANWGTGRLRVTFLTNSGSRTGNALTIDGGKYGFVESNTSTYQQVVIPLSAFAIPSSAQLRYLVVAVSGAQFSLRVDNIRLQHTSEATGGTGGGLTQTTADARYLQRALNLADVNSASEARANIGAAPNLLTIEPVAGTTYTLDAADAWHHLRFTNAAAITLTVPANATVAIAIGSRIRGTQAGAGVITLAPAVGVTLNSRGGSLSSAGTFAVFELEKVAVNEWDILGDVA